MKAFTDKRRVFWLGGITVLIVGFLVAAFVLPQTSDPTKGLGPAVHVPKMQNVPPDGEKLKLDTDQK
jgi:hypothetical protein